MKKVHQVLSVVHQWILQFAQVLQLFSLEILSFHQPVSLESLSLLIPTGTVTTVGLNTLLRDAAYCFPCRFFTTGTGKTEKTFTLNGFRGWKHASGKKGVLQVHDKCAIHRGAMLAWEESKRNTSRGTSIAYRLEAGRLQEIQSNRHYLISIVQVLLFCAHQEIALRGHDESVKSANRGNFLELLHLLAKRDSVVMERLTGGPRNATYTSPEVQNLLLNIMATMVRKKTCNAVQSAGPFSLLADESKDVRKTEHLTVALRYVDVSCVVV